MRSDSTRPFTEQGEHHVTLFIATSETRADQVNRNYGFIGVSLPLRLTLVESLSRLYLMSLDYLKVLRSLLFGQRVSCVLLHLITSSLGHDSFRVTVVLAPEVPLEAKDVDVLDKYRDPDEDG